MEGTCNVVSPWSSCCWYDNDTLGITLMIDQALFPPKLQTLACIFEVKYFNRTVSASKVCTTKVLLHAL